MTGAALPYFRRLSTVLVAWLLVACSGGGRAPLPAAGAVANARAVAVDGRSRSRKNDAGPSGFGALRATFQHSLVCDNGVTIAAYAQKYGIATIFVPVSGDDLGSLLAANPTTVKNLNAMLAVADVYVVSGAVAWLNAPTSVPSDVASLNQIAAMYPRLSGILYDIDPEDAPGWGSQQQTTIANYFTLVGTLESAPGASAFAQTLFTVQPNFATLYANGSSGPTMLGALEASPGVSGVTAIVPGSSANAQFAKIGKALSQLTKPFYIEAEATKYSKASYYGVSAAYLQSNLSQLQQRVAARNPLLADIEVNGWSDLYDSLDSVLPQPPAFNGTLPVGPLVPASGTTYLGAFVNPSGTGPSPAQTSAFEGQIGRPLGFNMHFYAWKASFPGSVETDDVTNGRIPLEAWNCGDTDANVAKGADDAIIIARAQAIKAFGAPIFLRWFWEMNLDDTNDAPRGQCYDPATDLPSGYFSPGEYIAAWQHIRTIFAQQGVTNVVWLWCVANAHGGPGQYYPGDDRVDWVAMDDYDTNDVSLQNTFYILATELAQFQEKPFMVNETGAHAGNQPAFLTGAVSTLQSQFPQIRALGYLDSTGTHQDWRLTGQGLAAFTTFAQDPYMSARSSTP